LTSDQLLGWTTLGSAALTATLHQLGTPWLEIPYDLVQPISWSDPGAFFAQADPAEHARNFNQRALCYMLTNTMNRQHLAANPGADLLAERTFFGFLLGKARGTTVCDGTPVDRALTRSCVSDVGRGADEFACVDSGICPEDCDPG
jgi:hypothetical protein